MMNTGLADTDTKKISKTRYMLDITEHPRLGIMNENTICLVQKEHSERLILMVVRTRPVPLAKGADPSTILRPNSNLDIF